jgi:hypothetical protein
MKANYLKPFLPMALGLALLLSACNEETNNGAPAKTILSEFTVSCAPFGSDSETFTRSAADGHAGSSDRVPEEVEIPLNDQWVLSASLEEEPPVAARADYESVNPGAIFWIVAYKLSGATQTYYADAKYSYDGAGKLTSDQPIMLTAGDTYKYVYYSYNSASAIPTYQSSIVGITPHNGTAPHNDLLWGESGPVSAGSSINVSTGHRFSRIKLRVSTSEAGPTPLESVSASFPTNYSATLSVSSGILSDTLPTTAQNLADGELAGNVAISSTTRADSEYHLVYTAGRPAQVKISGRIANTAFKDLMPTFSKRLVPGQSYILHVRIRKGLAWAGSNIYWDGEAKKLTFALHGDRTKEDYQGVYFLWGSLVGTSSALSSATTAWSGTSMVYYPTYVEGNPQASIWDSGPASSFNYTSWANIPNIKDVIDPAGNVSAETVDYFGTLAGKKSVINPARDSISVLYATQRGDICRYLGITDPTLAGYHLPTAHELIKDYTAGHIALHVDYGNWANAQVGIWNRIGADSWPALTTNGATPSGTFHLPDAGANLQNHAFFPAAGIRYTPTGAINHVGRYGLYWSSSAIMKDGAFYAYVLRFDDGGLNYINYDFRHGMTVRCVRNR